jgi:hypothetical protein
MTTHTPKGPKTRKPKVEAHPTKWSAVIDRGDRTSVSHYDTKAEADNVANAINLAHGKLVAFVNPPRSAWAGKDDLDRDPAA